ncbi:MAG: hypothetical protein AB3N16_07950 [Flavobacteriaceae bacterium]
MKAAINLLKKEIHDLKQRLDFPAPNPYGNPEINRINRVANEQISGEIADLEEALDYLKKKP